MKITKQVKILRWAIILMAIIAIASVASFVLGSNNPEYLVRVEDDGSSNAKEDEQTIIERKIVSSDNSEVQIRTSLKNNIAKNVEVAIVVDNSWSVFYNANENNTQVNNIKTQVTNFINGVFSNVGTANAKVSVSTNDVKGSMATSASAPTISGTASVLASGIDNGMQTFSTTEGVRRYMVIFTDATDEAKDKLLDLYNTNNVEVTSVIIDLSSNQFVNIDGTSVTKNLIEYDSTDTTAIDFSDIYARLKGELKDVVVEDRFSTKAIKYFDYEYVGTSPSTNVTEPIIENGKIVGVRMTLDSIYAGEEAYIKYNLKVKSDISSLMATTDINGDFVDTSKGLKATYIYDENSIENSTTNSPKVQFIKNFTVTIFAVNEYQTDSKIAGIQFNVTAKDMVTGKTLISNKAYTTNLAGEIEIDGLATLNNIQFTITVTANVDGYTTTPGAQFELEYDASTKGRKVINNEDLVWEAEDAAFNTNIYYPIKVKTFVFEVNLTEVDNLSSQLGGVDFKLIQPKLNNQVEMNVLEGTTDETGVLRFSPTVMTKNGTYEYVLSQESTHLGYEPAGIGKIKVTFTNGKVTKAETIINDKMVASRVNDSKVLVQVGNELKLDEKFEVKLNILDKDDLTPISGMSYELEVVMGGNSITYNTSKSGTDGVISLNLAGNKEIKLVIKEKDVNGKYIANTYDETYIFERKVGVLQPNFIQKSTNSTIDANIDSANNLVEFDLKYAKKSENDIVRVNVVDKDETDINIENIRVDLVKDGVTIPGGRTDANGLVDISIPSEAQGTYTYTLKLTGIPSCYNTPAMKTFNLTFDADGKIDLSSITSITDLPILSVEALDENLETEQNRGALVKAGLEVNQAYSYKFTVKLQDSLNGTPIADAKYNIVIRTETSDGDLIVRKLTNRTTDNEGLTQTNLILGPKVQIEVQQTHTNIGTSGTTLIAYKLDPTLQEINLTYDGTNVSLDSEAPHNATEGLGMGTTIDDKEIIYLHKNDPVTLSDAFLNLHIIKKDVYGGFISGLPLKITSKEASRTNINNEPLGLINLKTGLPLSESPICQDTDINGEVDLLRLIQIAGLIEKPQQEQAYEFTVYECEIDADGNYVEIPESEVTYRIAYKYDEYTSQFDFTNVDIIVGKKKIAENTEHSSYYTSYGFESRVGLFLYPYGGELGNMSLNLEKYDENGNKLEGAEYQVNVLRPGKVGNLVYKTKISDKIEIGGFYVNAGTVIEITELTAPVGYALNEITEMIEIIDVSEDGAITYNLNGTEKVSITNVEQNLLEIGTFKTDITLRLLDSELETFKVGILAKDIETSNPIANYQFNVASSRGNDKDFPATDADGKTSELIGGHYGDGEKVTYTITTKTPAPFFKEITPINVVVYFDANGKVDTTRTLASQTDAGYGTIWTIEGTNGLVGNDLDIKINLQAYDKLVVEIETVDKITGNIVTTVEYNIPESVNIVATGTTKLEVGYVNPGALTKYTLNSTGKDVTYKDIEGQEFILEYDSNTGDITGTPQILGDQLEYISHSGKTLKLRVNIEPKEKLTVEIETVNKVTMQAITHAEYTITPSPNMPATGTTQIEAGYYELGIEHNLEIISKDLGVEYVTPQNQGFKITFDETTGYIKGVPEMIGDNIEYISHDAAAKTLKIRILVEPKVKITVEIETIDIVTNQMVYGNVYEIPESPDITARGTTSIEVGWININTMYNYPTYTLKTVDMTNSAYKYQDPGDQTFRIGIDENGQIGGYQIIGDKLEYISHSGTTIKLRLKLEPKVVFVINNTAHTTREGLQGAKFEIKNLETEEIEQGTTDGYGRSIIYNGIHGRGTSSQEKIIVYKVTQISAKATYARVDDFYVKVHFNENRTIIKATLSDINGNEISNADNIWVNVTSSILNSTQPGYNGNDLGAVIIEVMNYPALRLNFENVDRRDDSVKLKDAKYEITSNTGITANITTDQYGQDTAYIDYVSKDSSIFFTIKQTVATQGYQMLEDFIIRVYFDSEGFVDSAYLVDKIDDNAQVINSNYIELDWLQSAGSSTIIMERSLSIKLRSTPIFTVVINKTTEDGTPINFAGLTVSAKEINTEEILASYSALTGFGWDKYTNSMVQGSVAGQKEYFIDRTLTNKTMEFEIEEYRNPVGYKKPEEKVTFNLEFDENGKVVPETMLVTSGHRYLNITSVDPDNFTITIQMINYEIETFGIHLTVEDTYDQNKKLENTNGLKYSVTTFIGNSKYGYRDRTMDTTLVAGRDSDGDGVRDVDYGEDYVAIKKVAIDPAVDYGANINKYVRTIRITPQNAPNMYYENTIGTESYYQNISRRMEIVVTFDTEGHITNAYFKTGKIDGVWYVDNRYLEISHSSYNLSIVIKHFPSLQIGINAVDEYTKEHLAGGSYNLQTYHYKYSGRYDNSSRVAAGYIGDSYSYYYYYPTYQKRVYTSTSDMATMNAICPTETPENSTSLENGEPVRYIYIYEMSEPTNYQQYEPRHNTGSGWYARKYIGYVKVYYNQYGEIDKSRTEISAGQSLDNNSTPNGTYFIKLSENQYDSKHAIQIDIEYKPTTTLKIHLIDEVTRAQLGNIRIYPFMDTDTTTSRSYAYRSISYYTSNSSSAQNVKYWGGAVADSNVTYKINTSVVGQIYTEYFFPGQVAINVGYDENGRVDSVVPATYDRFGDYNVEIAGWDNNVIDVYILFTRKFNIELIKFDEYDLNIDKANPLSKENHRLSATFDLLDDEGIATTVTTNTSRTKHNYVNLGKIQAGKTVKYTVTEIGVPAGYERMDDFELTVEFEAGGTIKTIATSNQYEEYKTMPYTTRLTQKDHVDLLAYLYNKPTFTINLNLRDEFYSNHPLAGGTFRIVSSKGDTYEGAAITDDKGNISAVVGIVYPGETVEYTISQTNKLDGYLANNEVATLWVRFDEYGRIEDYGLKPAGTLEYYSLPTASFIGQRHVDINVVNTPLDVKFGINKYDEVTNEGMQGVEFKVSKELVSGTVTEYTFITDEEGFEIKKIDEFAKRNDPIIVKYTLSEINVPGNYRMIEDVVIEVTYLANGRIGDYTIISNPSNVTAEVALNKMKYINGEAVHFALTIPNDNTFDLVIKDEDINYSGLGIEGTTYDVTIAGIAQPQKSTDSTGKIIYENRKENGRIEIRIAEDTIGEGYREDLANDISFIIEKAEDEYKITLDESYITYMGYTLISKNVDSTGKITNYEIQVNASNNTIVLLEINERTGIVSVKFKNETKLELTLTKNDINTGALLSDAQFEITSQVISPVPESVKTLTTTSNDKTDTNGILYFDLGVAPQNRIVKYTFKEITPPYDEKGDQYGPIKDIEMTIRFDSYGKIISIEENSIRAKAYLSSNTGNSRHMKIIVGNGTLKQAFTLKIISEDSITGERINDSTFRISALTSSGNIVMEDQIVKTSTSLDPSGLMMQEGIYIDDNVAEEIEGSITFKIEQDQCAQDYVFGNNIISGTVTIKKENIEDDALEAGVALSFDGVGITGFNASDVTIDKNNNEVIVVIKNDPIASLIIDKFYEDGGKTPLEDAEFNIKVEVDGATKYQDTKLTNEDGMINIDLGVPEYGKTVLYTLTEKAIDGFMPMDEIVLKVTYDSNGRIKKYEVIENSERATIEDTFELEREEYIINNGLRELANTYDKTYNTLDGRTVYTSIENIKEHIYNVVIGKHAEVDMLQADGTVIKPSELTTQAYLKEGAEYKITVKEENGEEYTWIDTTDEDGLITSKDFKGFGKIEVTIEELSAPDGYILDDEVKTLTFTKDKETGTILKDTSTTEDSDLDYEIVDNEIIKLNPIDDVEMLTMYLHKVDSKTGQPICDAPATFEVYLEEADGTLTNIGQGATDNKGLFEINLGNTFDEGIHKLILRETQAPTGYKIIPEDISLEAIFKEDRDGNVYLDSISTDSGLVTNLKSNKTYFALDVLNEKGNELGEYTIEIEKHTTVPGDDTLLEGARYEVKIMQENLTVIEVDEITNEEGKIQIPNLRGTGTVRVELKEIQAPTGYSIDEEDKYVEFMRDPDTGEFTKIDSNVEFDFVTDPDTGETAVVIKPQNEFATYAMYINKIDANTKYRILDNPASFEVYYYNKEEDLIEKVGDGQTDATGLLLLDELTSITKEGIYTYYIRETVSPAGYSAIDYDMEFQIEFKEDSSGNLYIANVTSTDENLNVTIVGKKYFKINVLNKKEGSILDYTLVLEKHTMVDGDNTLIPGATYRIKIDQEFGNDYDFTDTTDANGVIISDVLTGYGDIKIEIEELTAPNGFKIENSVQYIEIRKDRDTGIFSHNAGDLDYQWGADGTSTVYIKPRDEFADGVYALYINKVDAATGKKIQNNPVTFQVYREVNGAYALQGEYTTNEIGTVRIMSSSMPTTPGIYKYIVKEKTAPVNYELVEEGLEYEIDFALDDDGDMYIKGVASRSDKLKIDKFKEQYLSLNFLNEREQDKIYTVKVIKVDSVTGEPIKNDQSTVTDIAKDDMTAIFRITDENGNEYYEKSNEDGEIIFDKLPKPTEIPEGQDYVDIQLTVKEIMAPCGYKLERRESRVTLRFKYDDEGRIILDTSIITVESDADNVEKYELDSNEIDLYISNEEGENGEGYLDRGTYSIILNKIDADTKELIPGEAEFEVALENGERVKAAIKSDGKLEILDIPCPQEPGEYEYVITEIIAPTGYELNNIPQIFKVKFEEDPLDNTKLVITYAEEVYDPDCVIKVVSYVDNTVEINMENISDDLYVVSKIDDEGEVIYDVMESYQGRKYSLDFPFIDTKVAKYGRGCTVQEFIDNLDSNGVMTVWDKDGNQLDPSKRIATGMTLKSTKGSKELSFTIILKGDYNGDGAVRTNDSEAVELYIARALEITDPIQLRALDILDGGDGAVRTNDLTHFYQIIAER